MERDYGFWGRIIEMLFLREEVLEEEEKIQKRIIELLIPEI